MAGVVSIAWLRKGSTGVVKRKGALSIWSWSTIFTLHWGQGEFDGATQVGFELLLMIINQYQQIEQSESFI